MKRTSLIGLLVGVFLIFGLNAIGAQAGDQKQWSVMVFLNGDNDLDPYGKEDIREMIAGALMQKTGIAADDVNVIVLHDQFDQDKTTKIYQIKAGPVASVGLLKDYGRNIDMGDAKELLGFYRFAHENFPAQKEMLIIWNHGGGWRLVQEDLSPAAKDISYDDHSGNAITTVELGAIVREMAAIRGKELDILGMDACLMQMSEVLYELRGGARYALASQLSEPAKGWAYKPMLERLFADPSMSVETLGKVTADEYARSYDNGYQGNSLVQLSLVDVQKHAQAVAGVAPALKKIMNHYLSSKKDYLAIRSVMRRIASASMPYASNKDFIGFLEGLVREVPGLGVEVETLQAALRSSIIYNAVSKPSGLKGLMVWMPGFNYDPNDDLLGRYSKLGFDQVTAWGQFQVAGFNKAWMPDFVFSDGYLYVARGEELFIPGSKLRLRSVASNTAYRIPSGPSVFSLKLKDPQGRVVYQESQDFDDSRRELEAVFDFEYLPDWLPGKYRAEYSLVGPVFGEVTWFDELPVFERKMQFAPLRLESDHPYANNMDQLWRIDNPGNGPDFHIKFFLNYTSRERTDLDRLELLDADKNLIFSYKGHYASNGEGVLWSPVIPGKTAYLRLVTDAQGQDQGFVTSLIAY